jgi:hypothetical protein
MPPSYMAAAVLTAMVTFSSTRLIGLAPGPIPLRIEQSRVVNGRAVVELVNIGTRTIVAWGVSAQVKYADGTSRGQETMVDGFEQSVRKYSNGSVLPPGGRYVLVLAGVTNLTDGGDGHCGAHAGGVRRRHGDGGRDTTGSPLCC